MSFRNASARNFFFLITFIFIVAPNRSAAADKFVAVKDLQVEGDLAEATVSLPAAITAEFVIEQPTDRNEVPVSIVTSPFKKPLRFPSVTDGGQVVQPVLVGSLLGLRSGDKLKLLGAVSPTGAVSLLSGVKLRVSWTFNWGYRYTLSTEGSLSTFDDLLNRELSNRLSLLATADEFYGPKATEDVQKLLAAFDKSPVESVRSLGRMLRLQLVDFTNIAAKLGALGLGAHIGGFVRAILASREGSFEPFKDHMTLFANRLIGSAQTELFGLLRLVMEKPAEGGGGFSLLSWIGGGFAQCFEAIFGKGVEATTAQPKVAPPPAPK